VVPADDPKLVIVVGIDEAKRPLHTGGSAAAPLFAQMASAQLARFGIVTEPDSNAPRYTDPIEPEDPMLVAVTSDAAPAEVASPVAAPPTGPVVELADAAKPAPPTPKSALMPVAAPPPGEAPAPAVSVVSLGDRMLLPDFLGLTQSEVRRLTASTSLDVKMTGRGRAVTQEPAAGTILPSRQALVFIHFEGSERDDQGAGGGI